MRKKMINFLHIVDIPTQMLSNPYRSNRATPNQFKCALIGNLGVGKTAYIKQLLTGEFEKRYVATLGVEVHPLTLEYHTSTSNTSGTPGSSDTASTGSTGLACLNIWDCAGNDNFGGLRDGYWIMANSAIIMFDSLMSFKDALGRWTREFKRVIDTDVPIALVWNKYSQNDSDYRMPNERQELEEACATLKAKMPARCRLFKVNTKNCENIYNPINFLLRELIKDNTILVKPEFPKIK